MAIRNLRYDGDEILSKRSREIEVIDEKIKELAKDMIDTMHKYDGVGLAGPQVGILKRIIVIDLYEEGMQFTLINPVIISIFIGLSLFILNIKLPYIINRPIELLGNITTPLSMIVIGSMLCLSSISECVRNKKLYIVSFIRLILMPILIYFILKGIVYDKLLFSIPIVIVSMPVASNTAILSSEYNANDKLASQLVFMSTLFSIVTIPIISSILLI